MEQPERVKGKKLRAAYNTAFDHVHAVGYEDDIYWAMSLEDLVPDKEYAFSEAAWVIINSGFRYAVARKMWPKLRVAFCNFNPSELAKDRAKARTEALEVLNYPKKIDAILEIGELLRRGGLRRILRDAKKDPTLLTRLPFIGETTCWHLAKVLGIECVKPDIHLKRAAEAAGYDTPLALCKAIKRCKRGHTLTVIDTVLWRYGEQMKSRGWKSWDELFARG